MSIIQPICQPICQPIASKLTDYVGSGARTAFSAAKKAIQEGTSDVNILVIGDSTGNDSTEWVYLFGQWLATEYQTHSVSYRLWNDTGNVYDAAVSLGTGSGSNTIRIWNASVAGSRPELLMGSKFASAISAVSADCVIWNHGKNVPFSVSASIIEGSFVGPVEQVIAETGLRPAMILQNPNRDDNNMNSVITSQRAYASRRSDITLIDVFSAFNALGKPGSLFADNIHPSASGTAIFLSLVQSAWKASAAIDQSAAVDFFATTATNLIDNGDFSAFSGVRPDSWLQLTQVVASKDTVVVDGAEAYSLKLTNDANLNGRLYQSFSAGDLAAVAGKTMSVAAKRYATTSTAALFSVNVSSTSSGSQVYLSNNQTGGLSGFRWTAISAIPVPSDVTSIEIRLFADSAATIGTYGNFDRITAVVGDVPRNMA